MREGADPGEILMAPPQRLAPVKLTAGQAVTVRLEHDVQSSPMAGFGTFLQLNLEVPHGTDEEEIATAASRCSRSVTAAAIPVGPMTRSRWTAPR